VMPGASRCGHSQMGSCLHSCRFRRGETNRRRSCPWWSRHCWSRKAVGVPYGYRRPNLVQHIRRHQLWAKKRTVVQYPGRETRSTWEVAPVYDPQTTASRSTMSTRVTFTGWSVMTWKDAGLNMTVDRCSVSDHLDCAWRDDLPG